MTWLSWATPDPVATQRQCTVWSNTSPHTSVACAHRPQIWTRNLLLCGGRRVEETGWKGRVARENSGRRGEARWRNTQRIIPRLCAAPLHGTLQSMKRGLPLNLLASISSFPFWKNSLHIIYAERTRKHFKERDASQCLFVPLKGPLLRSVSHDFL